MNVKHNLKSSKVLIILCLLGVLCFLLFFLINFDQLKTKKLPNIVLILADDFGVGDIQAHFPNNKIPTPCLDHLVSEGMSFKDAHSSSSVCTPTRYGLLTGRYCWRTPLQRHVLACYEPPLIDSGRLTLPEILRRKGYRTAAIGKWHLGWTWPGPIQNTMGEYNILRSTEWDFTESIEDGPIAHGFDYYFGPDVPNFPPYCFIENNRTIGLPTAQKESRNLDGVPGAMLPGWEMDEILPAITRRAVDYIKEQSSSGQPFFLYFSMTSPHEPIAPSKDFEGKSGIAPIADFIMQTDWSVGEILKAIDAAGIKENTLLIFTADNGHSKYTGWDKLVDAGHYPSGPYRGGKGDIWEGGHRVPFIVRWPGNIAAGSSNHQLISLTDIFETCAELVDMELPPNAGEDSKSFLPHLIGEARMVDNRKSLISHSVNGEFAIRNSNWKLVFKAAEAHNGNLSQSGDVQLYNLEEDVSETTDLSSQYPQVVEELRGLLEAQIKRGRSTPGPIQKNDVDVVFNRFPKRRWAESQ